MATFRETIAKIKEAYNIVDLVEEENVRLSVSGPGEFKGLCPFHNEKSPSFKVSEPFQNYYCFGCHAKGDIFTFIQETRGCSMFDAMEYLASNKGIEINIEGGRKDDGPRIDLRKLYSLLADSRAFYRGHYDQLDISHPAKVEVTKRGMDPNDEVFSYAPEVYGALTKHLQGLGYSEELMLQSELVGKSDSGQLFDFFHGRLLVTLADFSGRPVSYSARHLFEKDSRAKWVNGKASPVFQKKATLFNLHNAKKSARLEKKIILTEGPFDALAIASSGIENVCASCGTAFTDGHLKSAMQLVGENGQLIFAFDGDEAGEEAARKVFLNFPEAHSMIMIAMFPEGKDPGDVYQEGGPEAIRKLIDSAIPVTEFVLKTVSKTMGLTDMNSRYRYIREISSKYLSVMTDKVLLDYMIRTTSMISGVDVVQIRQVYAESKGNQKGRAPVLKQAATEELNMDVVINSLDDSDICFVSAFGMLVRFADTLIPQSKGISYPEKFLPFLGEFTKNYSKQKSEGKSFRFIVEEYSDVDFAKHLQNQTTNKQIDEDNEDLSSHYRNLLENGERFHKKSIDEAKRATLLSAMREATSNEELYNMIKLMKEK